MARDSICMPAASRCFAGAGKVATGAVQGRIGAGTRSMGGGRRGQEWEDLDGNDAIIPTVLLEWQHRIISNQ